MGHHDLLHLEIDTPAMLDDLAPSFTSLVRCVVIDRCGQLWIRNGQMLS